MPIKIDDKTFDDFNSAVNHVKKTRPEIKDPEAYVASIEKIRNAKVKTEEAIKGALIECPFKKTQNRIKEAMERITSADRKLKRSDNVMKYIMPEGKKISEISQEQYKSLVEYIDTGKKVRPPKPTQKDRSTSMQAKQRLADINTCKYCSNKFRLLNMTPEGDVSCPECGKSFPKVNLETTKKRIASKNHKHSIQFRQAKREGEVGEYRGATQEKYWKYWLLNAKQTNGNGWGVDASSIESNIQKFIGRPFCVTAKQWFPESEYETYEHPYLPTNNLDVIFSHQAKYSAGEIVDIIKDKDDYYAMIKPHSRFASHSPPAFCSPAIFQLDPHEPENKIKKWEALHLAGLDRDPAYGAQVALLKGTCIGTSVECKVQFKGAKQQIAVLNSDVIKAFKNKQPLKGTNFKTDGNSFFLFGHEIARHHPNGIEVSTAGFPTAKTYDTLRALGINTRIQKGVTTINNTTVDPHTEDFHLVPHKDVQGDKVYFSTPEQRQKQKERNQLQNKVFGIKEQRKFNQTSREKITGNKKIIPISATQLLPDEQREINSITGVDSPIERPKKGTDAHHIFPKSKFPALANNPNNSINLTREEHAELHRLNKFSKLTERIRQSKQRLAAYNVQQSPNVTINPEHGRIIADAYDKMKHDPSNPEVQESYTALINETGKQYKDLIAGGLKTTKSTEYQYPDSKTMHDDVEKNNHLYYFPTEGGYGAGDDPKDHPMLKPTEFKDSDGNQMPANDIFRIVHDINGHHLGGKSGFGPKGEHQAYLTHRKMYSETAGKALASETMGQNNWVNFGPMGEKNRADPKHTTYAEQKAGLLPPDILKGVYHNA